MPYESVNRRHAMKAFTAAGITGIAGCMGGDGDDETEEDGDEEEVHLGDEDASQQIQFAGWGEDLEREVVEGMLETYVQNNDAAINYQSLPVEDYTDRLRTQFGANEEPDVFYMGGEYVSSFSASDVLLELESRLSDEFIADFDQEVLDAFAPRREEDGLYFLPKDFQTLAVFYDETLFSQAGYDEFPETWSEFKDALHAVKDETDVDYPFLESAEGNAAGWIWYTWVPANGGQIMNDDRSESVVASDENVEAMEFFQELREEEVIGTINEIGAETDQAALNQGQVAMVTAGGWIPAIIKDEYPDFFERIETARPPRPDDGEYGNLIFGAGYSISARTEYEETSLDIVETLMGDDIKPWLESGIALSIRKSQREGFVDLYDEHDHWSKMFEMTNDRLETWEFGPHTEEIFNTLYPQIEGVIQGEVDAREALETAEDRINNEILE